VSAATCRCRPFVHQTGRRVGARHAWRAAFSPSMPSHLTPCELDGWMSIRLVISRRLPPSFCRPFLFYPFCFVLPYLFYFCVVREAFFLMLLYSFSFADFFFIFFPLFLNLSVFRSPGLAGVRSFPAATFSLKCNLPPSCMVFSSGFFSLPFESQHTLHPCFFSVPLVSFFFFLETIVCAQRIEVLVPTLVSFTLLFFSDE